MVVSTLKDGQTLNFAVAGKDLKYYRGVELKTVFSPGSEALSQKSPSRSSAFSSELSSLNSIFSLQKTLSVDAYKIANSPDFAIGVDTYNYGSDQHADLSKWVDANGARTIILEEILRSAPKAKVLDDDLLKRRMAETIEKDKTRWQDSDTNVLSWLYSRDEVDRKLVVKIYYTPLESSYSPDNQGILVIAVSFNRVALTEYGFDEITAYSESQSENVRRGDVATNVLEGLLKSSIHKFAEKWAVANTVVIPAIISGK